MSDNANLIKANKYKNDEFYTRLGDIIKELEHYKDYFKGKAIYCYCNHPDKSNFVRYSRENFRSLGIKELIATYYQRVPERTLFGFSPENENPW